LKKMSLDFKPEETRGLAGDRYPQVEARAYLLL
jgi:hypothetical protein